MDIKRWEAMIVSVEKGSFTSAAEVLGYTQSGLTHMMNRLEEAVGYSLLIRGRDGIRLTPEGEELLPKIHELLRINAELEATIREVNEGKKRVIRIGTYASMAQHWLPSITCKFQAEYPNIHLEINCCTMEEIYKNVADGSFDLAFTSGLPGSGLNWLPLKEDTLLAILPADYPLQSKEWFSVSDYNQSNFLMPSFGCDPDVLPILEQCRIKPAIQLTSVDDLAVISMVEHGLGISMLSELIIKGRTDNIIALPLKPFAVRQLGILSRPEKIQTTIVREFIDCAREVVSTL
ncbi:MAG: LysR family transcriptional regulator [Oscillospiraceae bacterium]